MNRLLERIARLFRPSRSASGKINRRAIGDRGEQLAATHLKQKGFRIDGCQVRVGRRDELDLVTRSPDGVLVFVEVKTRSDERFGRPFAAINRRKRKALTRAAWTYIKAMRPPPRYFRFDVVEVVGDPDGPAPVIRHIENAFSILGAKRIGW